MKFSPLRVSQKTTVINQPTQTQQIIASDREKEFIRGFKRVRISIKDQLDNITRPINNNENKQIEFLDKIQEKIFENLGYLTPEILTQTLSINTPPICLECALLTLQTLFQIDESDQGDYNWKDLQQSLQKRGRRFISDLHNFQTLTMNNQFQRQNIIRAKNHLLRYIVEDQLINQEHPYQNPIIQNIVSLAENLIGFVEVYDALMKSLILIVPEQVRKSEQLSLYPTEYQQIQQSHGEDILIEDQTDRINNNEGEEIIRTVKKVPMYQKSKPSPQRNEQIDNKLSKKFNTKQDDKEDQSIQTKLKIDSFREDKHIVKTKKRVSSATSEIAKPLQKHETHDKYANKHTLTTIKVVPQSKDSQIQQRIDSPKSKIQQDNHQIEVHNIQVLNQLIENNKSNIKQLMSEQIDLNQKIENESNALQYHLDQLQERDEEIKIIQIQKEMKQKSQQKIVAVQKQQKTLTKPKQLHKKNAQSYATGEAVESLRTNIQQSENDRVKLENELNRLLKIIDEKARTIPEQYSRIKTNLLNE